MVLGGHRQHEGTDLVGNIAVCGDPVRADNDAIDQTVGHEVTTHAIGDKFDRKVVLPALPNGEPRTLEKRPRFIGIDDFEPVFDPELTNDAERRSPHRMSPTSPCCNG